MVIRWAFIKAILMDHILSIVLLTPLAGLLVLLFIPSSNARAIKLWANIGKLSVFFGWRYHEYARV